MAVSRDTGREASQKKNKKLKKKKLFWNHKNHIIWKLIIFNPTGIPNVSNFREKTFGRNFL